MKTLVRRSHNPVSCGGLLGSTGPHTKSGSILYSVPESVSVTIFFRTENAVNARYFHDEAHEEHESYEEDIMTGENKYHPEGVEHAQPCTVLNEAVLMLLIKDRNPRPDRYRSVFFEHAHVHENENART
jgi:hypothetical protein